ncbi:MAG TPA: hypothetical protein VIX63_14225 [Vicinamibacterales bacterium]
MTLNELIETLQDLAEDHGGDVEVRLAQQPRWPFEYSIGEVAVANAMDDADEDDDEEEDATDDPDAAAVVYIGEGRQLGYLGGVATRALGWGRR